MPRTAITATKSTRSGVALPAETAGDATNDHEMANDGHTIFTIRNSGATLRNVAINFSKTVDGQTVTPKPDTIAAGVTKVYGPYPTAMYGTLLTFDVDHAELMIRAISAQG